MGVPGLPARATPVWVGRSGVRNPEGIEPLTGTVQPDAAISPGWGHRFVVRLPHGRPAAFAGAFKMRRGGTLICCPTLMMTAALRICSAPSELMLGNLALTSTVFPPHARLDDLLSGGLLPRPPRKNAAALPVQQTTARKVVAAMRMRN